MNQTLASYHIKHRSPGFSLIEILVSIAVLAILSLISFSVLGSIRKQGYLTEEVAAGKNLIAAYLLYSQDNRGELLPGFDERLSQIRYQNRTINFPAVVHRYPFRIAPYLDDGLEGATLLFSNKDFIEEQYGSRGFLHDYMLSLNPLFGINYAFLGGRVLGNGQNTMPANQVLTRLSQVEEPLLVFASSGMGPVPDVGQFQETVGYNVVYAPNNWVATAWGPDANVEQYGHVSPRHNGKAICAFTDGSVQALTIEEMRDMKLWSKRAVD